MLTNMLTGFFMKNTASTKFFHDRPSHNSIDPYPEFHFETETAVDSLTGLQRYKGDFIVKFYQGNNFQLEMRLRFFQKADVQFMEFGICLFCQKF